LDRRNYAAGKAAAAAADTRAAEAVEDAEAVERFCTIP
jgi:hypothetical protein